MEFLDLGKDGGNPICLGQLRQKGKDMGQPVRTYEINCRQVDTRYRVVQTLATKLSERGDVPIPFTGWPTDRV